MPPSGVTPFRSDRELPLCCLYVLDVFMLGFPRGDLLLGLLLLLALHCAAYFGILQNVIVSQPSDTGEVSCRQTGFKLNAVG